MTAAHLDIIRPAQTIVEQIRPGSANQNELLNPNSHIPVAIHDRRKRAVRLTKRWNPVTWKPIYEEWVALHCIGRSNISIAEQYGYTPVQVSNLLNCDRAKLLMALIREKLREETTSTYANRLQEVTDKFLKKIERVASDEDLFHKSPFAVIDRGITLLKGTGHLRSDNNVINNNTTVNGNALIANISSKDKDDLTEALQKLNETQESLKLLTKAAK